MKRSFRKGVSFGLTSGIITTLGLVVGLHSGTNSKIVVISGILLIAIADAMSDALGIHIAEESDNRHTTKEIWEATIATFLSKFIFSLTFILPVIFFEISMAILVSVIYGLTLLVILSYYIAKKQKIKPLGVILEHLFIAVLVIIITHFIGEWISNFA